MKKVLILPFLFWSFISFSQSENWTDFTELDGVKIESSILDCGVNELITFKFTNTNSYDVSVSWYEEFWIDGVCKQTGNSEEHFRVLSLKSGEEIKGNCSFQDSFYIGSKIERGNKTMVLTHFDLKNISVIIGK